VEAVLSHVKYIHLALEGDAILGHSSLIWVPVQDPTLIGLNLPLAALVGIIRKGKILTCI
jgi:hypothetical protein